MLLLNSPAAFKNNNDQKKNQDNKIKHYSGVPKAYFM